MGPSLWELFFTGDFSKDVVMETLLLFCGCENNFPNYSKGITQVNKEVTSAAVSLLK